MTSLSKCTGCCSVDTCKEVYHCVTTHKVKIHCPECFNTLNNIVISDWYEHYKYFDDGFEEVESEMRLGTDPLSNQIIEISRCGECDKVFTDGTILFTHRYTTQRLDAAKMDFELSWHWKRIDDSDKGIVSCDTVCKDDGTGFEWD